MFCDHIAITLRSIPRKDTMLELTHSLLILRWKRTVFYDDGPVFDELNMDPSDSNITLKILLGFSTACVLLCLPIMMISKYVLTVTNAN